MAVSEATLLNAGVQAGLLEAGDLPELKLTARRERIRLLEAVTRAGRFPESALYQALADLRGMPFLLPHDLVPEESLVERLPRLSNGRRAMLPVRRKGELYLALSDPDDQVSLDSARRALGEELSPALAAPEALAAVLRRYAIGTAALLGGASASDQEENATAILDQVMKDAYLRRASDIHFEPMRDAMRVRLRVDGHLQEFPRPFTPGEAESVVTRIKVLAALDITEQRAAQDGGMEYTLIGWDVPPIDIRVATMPSRFGERATMRLLGQGGGDGLSLTGLGMGDHLLGAFRESITRPYGMVLVTGPTGSGKSTTLYAALREIDAGDKNILTVEDPVEQTVEGITQVQVSNKLGFANTLRAFLRHDPDVILVGEIRDLDTADTAVKAAMTGHLVLSTLHTNDAPGAVTRLSDIGVPPYLSAATLAGVIAQRLVRRLCPHCSEPRAATAEEIQELGLEAGQELRRRRGCPVCLGTGYHGRVGLFEALWIDDTTARAIAGGANEDDLRQAQRGYTTLWEDACAKVREGATDFDEIRYFRPAMDS